MYFHIFPILQRLGAQWLQIGEGRWWNIGQTADTKNLRMMVLEPRAPKNMNQNSGKNVRWLNWLIFLEWLSLKKMFNPFHNWMKVPLDICRNLTTGCGGMLTQQATSNPHFIHQSRSPTIHITKKNPNALPEVFRGQRDLFGRPFIYCLVIGLIITYPS